MRKKYSAFSAACVLLLAACENSDDSRPPEPMLAPLSPTADWADASAGFVSPEGVDIGSVAFANAPNGGVLIRVDLKGLSQGWHGIHLHQVADCSDGANGFKASGSHVDPDNNEHGLLNPAGPERADLPNIYAGGDGRASAEIFAGGVTLFSSGGAGPAGLIDEDGFAVIVHENPDDHMTQPIGGAGSRVACAAITGE